MSKTITIGKLRGLQQCTSPRGIFTCLALDHRQNLRRANPIYQSDAELSRFKMDVTRELAAHASAVLLDPEVSAAQAIAYGALPGNIGLVVALESTGYGGVSTSRQSQILPGWSVEKAKRMGASMIKLLVYYHPDATNAAMIEAFVRQVAAECSLHDIGLMLEPLSYSLALEKGLSSEEKRQVVVETARRLICPGVDVLKAEFPLDTTKEKGEIMWAEACTDLSAASSAPWIVLSAAVDFETYHQQVATACRAGASGCAVGRAVWQEAVGMDGSARLEFLQTVARERLERLATLCESSGRPFGDFYAAEALFDWYRQY